MQQTLFDIPLVKTIQRWTNNKAENYVIKDTLYKGIYLAFSIISDSVHLLKFEDGSFYIIYSLDGNY